MEKKFSEGKWKLDGDLIVSEKDDAICDVNPIGVTKTVYRNSYKEAIANAKLIAAAPALLESLQLVYNNLDAWDEINDDDKKIIKQAINKATE